MEFISHCIKRNPNKLEGRATAGMLIIFLVLSLLGWIYLTQASHVATTSRRNQELEAEKARLHQENMELMVEIAAYESVSRLAGRAQELGFVAIAPDDADFMAVCCSGARTLCPFWRAGWICSGFGSGAPSSIRSMDQPSSDSVCAGRRQVSVYGLDTFRDTMRNSRKPTATWESPVRFTSGQSARYSSPVSGIESVGRTHSMGGVCVRLRSADRWRARRPVEPGGGPI